MANDNIYDIINSEEVARQTGSDSSGDGGTSIVGLIIGMDTDPLIADGDPVPEINVTSIVTNLPIEWEVSPGTHQIYAEREGAGGYQLLPSTGTDTSQVGVDSALGTAALINNPIRRYYSTLIVRDRGDVANTLTVISDIIVLTAVTSIYYGLFSGTPTNIVDLSERVLSTVTVLPIASNNPTLPNTENFFIAVLTGDTQPQAIADEHGLIAAAGSWTLHPAAISGYNLYASPFPVELVGTYIHKYTLIYL